MKTVLIMVDQQQAASLPLYGNRLIETPTLDALAEQGCVFNHAFTSYPLCTPARASLFSGLYPSQHGSLDNQTLLHSEKASIVQHMKDRGLTLGLTGKNHCFRDPELELLDCFAQCNHKGPFDATGEVAAAKAYLQECGIFKQAWGVTTNPHPASALGTAWTCQQAIDFVHKFKDDDFFLWLSIADPHVPFQTSEPYASLVDPGNVELPPYKNNEWENKPRSQYLDYQYLRGDMVSDDHIRKIRAMYYGMNAYIDAELGRFMATMTELSLGEDTLFIYVSDHGEYLGEHKLIRKSKSAYDCLIHIPLIIKGPGVPKGIRHDEFVNLEDLMPTILHFLNIEPTHEMAGRNLFELFDQPHPKLFGRDWAYGEYGRSAQPIPKNFKLNPCASPTSKDFHPHSKVGHLGRMRYLRTRDWKLATYIDDQNELYDLNNDPYELNNLYDDPVHRSQRQQLTEQLLELTMLYSIPPQSHTIC